MAVPQPPRLPPSISLRQLRWPDDRALLERLDTGFTTSQRCEVHATGRGFTVIERPLAAVLHKKYHVLWEELTTATVGLVARRDDLICGVATLRYEQWNRRAVISHLYVDRHARRQGVGATMVAALEGRARDLHARCLWVETQDVNAPAIHFYERNGFVLSGLDTSLYDERDVPDETALFFAKWLAEEPHRS